MSHIREILSYVKDVEALEYQFLPAQQFKMPHDLLVCEAADVATKEYGVEVEET